VDGRRDGGPSEECGRTSGGVIVRAVDHRRVSSFILQAVSATGIDVDPDAARRGGIPDCMRAQECRVFRNF
jgi:hypothetical protein